MAYGIGQGLAQGVQMGASFLVPAMQMKQQGQQFDKRMAQQDKQFYDRLAIDQGWRGGYYGDPSPGDEQRDAQPTGSVPTGSIVPTSPAPGASLAQVGRLAVPGFAAPSPGPVMPNPSPQSTPGVPNRREIGPHTPLPPLSMMRPPRRAY